MKTKKEDLEIRVKSTSYFKLKDKPNRNYQPVNLMKQFGFIPEVVIIEKLRGVNNVVRLVAVLTPDEIAKEDKLRDELTIGHRETKEVKHEG